MKGINYYYTIIMFVLNSALEQFELTPIFLYQIGNVEFTFTNSSFYMFLANTIAASIFFGMSLKVLYIIPTPIQHIINNIYYFVKSMLFQFVAYKGNKYFVFIFTLFIFILTINLIGMVPYSFTPTSHIIITFGLSMSVFLGLIIIGVSNQGFHFLSLFFPAGSPILLAPLLVGIEIISYISRVFSLAIRLFANIMSGHTLLNIISSFTYKMFSFGGALSLVAIIPLLLLIVLNVLELGVSMLQAYVFTVLSCIYLKDSILGH